MFFKFLGSIEFFWAGTWTESKQFLKPGGYGILQDLIDSLKQYEVALRNGDLFTLETLYLTSAKLELELIPFTVVSEFSKTLTSAANACKEISTILKTGGNLYDVATFEKRQLTNVNAILNNF